MAFKTWQFKAGGGTYTAKAKKDDVERLARQLSGVVGIRQYQRELTGVIGESERESSVWIMFGNSAGVMPDPDGYEQDKAALFQDIASAAQPLGPQAVYDFTARAREIITKHMPVLDSRETPEQRAKSVAESNAAAAAHQEKHAAEAAAFLDRFAEGDKEISWGDGEMAIYLRMTYNDSDSMTDYYSPHCGWGQRLLLDVVPKGARTEAVARAVVAKYPDLAKMVFGWHTENYSMGHGNYLMSVGRHGQADMAVQDRIDAMTDKEREWADRYQMMAEAEAAVDPGTYPDVIAEGITTYGGIKDPVVSFEIEFQPYPGSMVPYKGYAAAHAPATAAAPASGETMTSNGLLYIQPDFHEKRGVPIWLVKLSEKVDRDVYNRYAAIARRFKVRWSSWGPKTKHGFVFYDEAKAKEFVALAANV